MRINLLRITNGCYKTFIRTRKITTNSNIERTKNNSNFVTLNNPPPISQDSSTQDLPQYLWEKGKVHRNFWLNKDNQKMYLEWLAQKLNIRQPDDWYKFTTAAFIRNYGRGLLNVYNNSMSQLLQELIPDNEWHEWLFQKAPMRFWAKLENRKKFILWFEKKMGITKKEDWYNFGVLEIQKSKGGFLIAHYHHSMVDMLKDMYPEEDWLPWKFKKIPEKYFDSIENQRNFVKWLEAELGITTLEQWYTVPISKFRALSARTILENYYSSSPYLMLKAIYPDYKWKPWKFQRTPRNIFEDPEIVKECIKDIEAQLGIESLDQWYRVSVKQLREMNFRELESYFKGIIKPLKIVYPNYPWDAEKFATKSKKSAQRWLIVTLKRILPNTEIQEEARFRISDQTYRKIELDVWIPEFNLAFEYQGEQHYYDVSMKPTPHLYQTRDSEKLEFCSNKGITLIEIPYWWQGDKHSLAATISQVRPDVVDPLTLPPFAKPIPKDDLDWEIKHDKTPLVLFPREGTGVCAQQKKEISKNSGNTSDNEISDEMQDMLWAHSLKSLANGSFKCRFGNCNYTTGESKTMRAHLTKNHRKKNFQCGFCGEKFADRRGIDTHWRRANQEQLRENFGL